MPERQPSSDISPNSEIMPFGEIHGNTQIAIREIP